MNNMAPNPSTAVRGRVDVRLMYVGSKSEGNVAFLLTPEGMEYRLMRRNEYYINDDVVASFNGMTVDIEGEITDGWLIADAIVAVPSTVDSAFEAQADVEQKTENDE